MDCEGNLQPAIEAQVSSRREVMVEPEDAARMVRLHELGWGSRRIAEELGVARNTVRRYLRQGGWAPYQRPRRSSALDGHEEWLKRRFLQHRGNADVVRQELAREHGIEVSLRTVERAVKPYREELEAEAKATVRFETAPGEQLQIDFGCRMVEIGGVSTRVYLFVATLGYSRRGYTAVFRHERQSAWMAGLDGAFRHFGGVTRELLLDNARALVKRHDRETREVEFNGRFAAFCRYWGVTPRACAPYRARTKGKDERGVGYVKRNALAGRRFNSLEHLSEHLAWWMREVSDVRIHGTTGERPIDRFESERERLRPVDGRPPFHQVRELERVVQSDCFIDIDTNRYSVPWTLIGQRLTAQVIDGVVRLLMAGRLVAEHVEAHGTRQMVRDSEHFAGLAGGPRPETQMQTELPLAPTVPPELLRPLSVYEELVGGGW